MKKTSMILLLVLCLAVSLAACSSKPASTPEISETVPEETPAQNETQEPVIYDLETTGVSFELPAALQNTKGVIRPSYDSELTSGVWVSGLTYYAMTEEKYTELTGKQELSEAEQSYASARILDVLRVFTIDGGRGLDALAEVLSSYGLDASGYQAIGTVGEYSFFADAEPEAEYADSQAAFDEGFRADYDAVIAALDDLSWVQIYEPEKTETATAGDSVEFETVDLDGNPVKSAEIFSQNKLTVINIWGTFCGPCINEMPDLEELNGRLAEKGCAMIGVVCDVAGPDDTELIDEAKEIIADTGVTYRNLLPWDGFDTALPAQYIPTTYLVDSEGKLVGDPAVGARGADDYEALIDEALAQLG